MYCTQCGNQLRDGDEFCSKCGKRVSDAPVPDPGSPLPRPKRQLRRIMAEKKIAGVCAGFARYFDLDITLMRIIFVALLVLPPGIGAICYIVGWIAMPRDDTPVVPLAN